MTAGPLRDRLEYSHADEAALSALFEEFGSSQFAYFESDRWSGAGVAGRGVAGLGLALLLLLLLLR